MADKMMRMAGRTEDGTAKGIKTDKNGRLLTGNDYVIFLNELGSGGGREILAGATWESDVFNAEGLDRLTINTMLNVSEPYEVRVIECVELVSGTTVNRTVHNLSNDNIVSNASLEAPLTGLTNKFKIRVTNKSVVPLKIGLFAYGSGDNTLKYYDANQKTFKQQSQIATETTLNKYVTNTNVLMNEAGTGGGREILAGATWESELLNVEGVERLTIDTMLNSGEPYRMTVYEYMLLPTGGTKEITKHELSNGGVAFNQHFETYLSGSANRIKITISNIGKSSIKAGLHVVGSKWSYLNYYNEADKKFVPQQQIATEETLAKIEHKFLEKNGSVQDIPHLTNIKWIEKGIFVNWFHDGFFYGSYDTFLYKSADGETWQEIHDFDTETGLKIVLLSDTNRIIVTTFGGEVFISDEEGVFNSEPSFVTQGSFDERFGHFKYANIIGLSTYSAHGLEYYHEAFLSTDNGATFKKVFDNSNFDDLPLVDDFVHIHDMDYDPYSGRLYLWNGDSANRTLNYSDDFGETWKMAFERGALTNHTQIISTPNGIALGIDGAPGGLSYVHIDRSKRINPPLDINMVEPKFWVFSDDDRRYVANRKWVDRTKNIYLIPYTGEQNDGNHGAIAFSRDGYKWQLIHKSTAKGHYYGIYGVQYGNGKLVAMQKDVDDKFRIMIADVDLES